MCSNLTTVYMEGVRTLESGVFYGCSRLTSVYIDYITSVPIFSGAYNFFFDTQAIPGLKIYVRESNVADFKAASG